MPPFSALWAAASARRRHGDVAPRRRNTGQVAGLKRILAGRCWCISGPGGGAAGRGPRRRPGVRIPSRCVRVRAKTIRHRIWRRSCRGPPPRPPLSSTRPPPQEVAVTAAPLTPRDGRPGRRASTPARATTSRAAGRPVPRCPCGRRARPTHQARRGPVGGFVAGGGGEETWPGPFIAPGAVWRGRTPAGAGGGGRPPRPLSGPRTGGGTQHGPPRRADTRAGNQRDRIAVQGVAADPSASSAGRAAAVLDEPPRCREPRGARPRHRRARHA